MILIFLGPPGAGKGTQAKFVSEKFHLPHLSTGQILRDRLSTNDKKSETIKKTMDSGELVSDEILNSIISERIVKKDCFNGFILDGYPRTINQTLYLENEFKKNKYKLNFILEINIKEESILKRIKSRALVESRGDDEEHIIKTRLSKYYADTKPVSEYYKKNYSLLYNFIKGDLEIDRIRDEILNLLKNHWNLENFLYLSPWLFVHKSCIHPTFNSQLRDFLNGEDFRRKHTYK